MSVEENKAIERRVIEEIFNKHNLALVDELFDTSYVYHGTGGVDPQGREEFSQEITMLFSAFPDFHGTVEDMVAEGDKVVSRSTFGGKHQGEYMGIAPTGKRIKFTGLTISQYENGKCMETWDFLDLLGMMQQLGVVPPTGQDIQKDMEGYLAAWNAHDVNKILSFFTDDAVYEDVPLGIISRGKKEITTFISNTFVDFPDFKIEVKAASEWVMSGTFAHSSMPPMPATGKTFSVRGASITEFRNGKISRNSDYYNAADFLQQVGLMPKQP